MTNSNALRVDTVTKVFGGLVAVDDLSFDGRRFLLGQKLLVGLTRWTFQRRHGRTVPEPPDVGVTPGRLGR